MLEDFGDAGPRAAQRPRGWVRRHKVAVALLALLGVLLGSVVGYAYYLNSKLGQIPQFQIERELARPDRPPAAEAPEGDGFAGATVLLVGVDNPDAAGIQSAVRNDEWVPGVYRSDAMLLMHVDSDGRDAQVISIPRDSYVPVPGYGKTKLNAAFSFGGPGLLLRTLEDLLDHRIDHVVAIDMEGLGALTQDFGGVEVELEEPLEVPATGETVPAGKRQLSGESVMRYVQERKNLPRGDFDRVQRHQTVLRGIAAQVLSSGNLANPLRVRDLLNIATQYVVTDEGLTPSRMRSLAWESRRLRTDDIRFLTVPYEGTATISGASVVVVKPAALRELFDAVEEDNFESWLGRNVDEADMLDVG